VTLNTYQLRPSDQLLMHGSRRPHLLHDHDSADDAIDPTQVHNLVSSGDGFISLATALADTTHLMAIKPEKAGPELEKIILTLLYLQDHYEICRKPTPQA
jgi:hypothetical protein